LAFIAARHARGDGIDGGVLEADLNILEEHFEILLANAHHLKNVPGRKTDIRDCQWIAQLLQHGLLKGSFIPPRSQRELRDLTRQRTQLVDETSRISNRIQKVLEDANVKLGSWPATWWAHRDG